MAQRRMFSLKVIDTDEFLDMPPTTQNLYFHLGMRADDDGFVSSPKKIMKIANSADDDMKVLLSKRFIIPFASGICVIRHWKIHNYIQKDRHEETHYLKEKSTLIEDKNRCYETKDGIKCIQNVSKPDTQVRLGKVRLGKDRIDSFNSFWKEYPNPKKIGKQVALKSWIRLNPGKKLAEIILKDIAFRKTTEDWLSRNGKFIPYPATYLNQCRWEDEDKGSAPEKKPYFRGDPVYGEENNRKVKINGEFKEFAGREEDLEWR